MSKKIIFFLFLSATLFPQSSSWGGGLSPPVFRVGAQFLPAPQLLHHCVKTRCIKIEVVNCTCLRMTFLPKGILISFHFSVPMLNFHFQFSCQNAYFLTHIQLHGHKLGLWNGFVSVYPLVCMGLVISDIVFYKPSN